ncbi:MAG: linear amide C-N hydrolase, partial [Gammaproteobacteria bacterium]|nr:linear amide C-N hydrolase [Gammaproteobacteria bacterium]
TNLRNYVNLSPNLPSGHVINGIMFGATGQGSGMVGLPGDASPPSRFVKIAALVASATPADNAATELTLAQHIINNVDIPVGFVRAADNGKTDYDYTQWTVFKDLTHKKLYFRTYGDSTIRYVSLDKVDFSKNAVPLIMPIDSNTNDTLDVTNAFLHTK